MPNDKIKIIFPKGTKVGLPHGSWSLDAKGNIVAFLSPKALAFAKMTNERLPQKARQEGKETLLKLGGI